MIDKMWKTNDTEEFTKSELVEFHNDIEIATDDLLKIMEENRIILGIKK